jgi:hypothetical protein
VVVLVPGGRLGVLSLPARERLQPPAEIRILAQRLQLRARNGLNDDPWVTRETPQLGLNLFPQLVGGMAPGPLQVQCEREKLPAAVDVTGKEIMCQDAHRTPPYRSIFTEVASTIFPECYSLMKGNRLRTRGAAGASDGRCLHLALTPKQRET